MSANIKSQNSNNNNNKNLANTPQNIKQMRKRSNGVSECNVKGKLGSEHTMTYR